MVFYVTKKTELLISSSMIVTAAVNLSLFLFVFTI